MPENRKTVGIIGLGAFGRFMAKHLLPHYRVLGYDVRPPSGETMLEEGIAEASLAGLSETAAADVVVFAVPLAALEEVALRAAPHIRPGAVVLDVVSVKVKPTEILGRIVPAHAEYLATHPLFGPQSGKNGIAGLRMALCPIRIAPETYYRICDFLTDVLKLFVLRTDPDEHDREMAKVQAMTHFMSRALREIGLEPSLMATRAYEKLQEFASIVLSDSWDLFLTIEKGNPHADVIRKKLISELTRLEEKLEQSESESRIAGLAG